MRKNAYNELPYTFKNDVPYFSTERHKVAFVKQLKDGTNVTNIRKFDHLKYGKQKVRVCHVCINRIACEVIDEGFCEGKNLVIEESFVPQFKKIKNSSQFAATIGYSYSYMGAWVAKLKKNDNKDEDEYYDRIVIPKKSGEDRVIYAPDEKLKSLQKCILSEALYKYIDLPENVVGFVPEHSTLDHALPHVKKPVIIALDLKDFFPSVYAGRVNKCLRKFFPKHTAMMITRICSYKRHMAQGIPTSPFLANLAFKKADLEIIKLCKRKHWVYTRYADDMAFSPSDGRTVVHKETIDNFISDIYRIVGKHDFRVNSKKTRVMHNGKTQKICGIIVNEKPNIPKHVRDRLRATIHNCKKTGIKSQTKGGSIDLFIKKMDGYLAYVKSINKSLFNTLNRDWKEAKLIGAK